MADKTKLNPELRRSVPTAVNDAIIEEYNRQNGIAPPPAPPLEAGAALLGKYTILRQLEVSSGEAELYVCACEGEEYVAKVYKRQFAVKPEVVDKLLTLRSPFVARLFETGQHNGRPVEILPYYKNGSLLGRTYTEEALLQTIVPAINEGLRALHEEGIIHKDLKPSNIMLCDDGESIAIIDFGISSVVDSESTILVTQTGMTPEYSAPETFRGVFYEGSDYYSLGITLYELYCGYTPYANMQPEEIEQYVSVQRVPFPEDMPPRLQALISALTYYDITFRREKDNPNRRWTYDEVRRWLEGEELILPGRGFGGPGQNAMPEYEFMGETYTDPAALALAFARHWEEGKKQLFRGHVTAHFRRCNPDLARKCLAAEEEAGRENGKDDIIYWKLLYQLNPRMPGFFWRGESYESLPAFGRDVLERLWDRDESRFPFYASLLSERLLSAHVAQAAPRNERLKSAAAAIEDSYALEKLNGTDMKRTYYLMAFTLSGQKLLLLNGEQFRTVGELAGYMRGVLDESYERFQALCHQLVDYDGNLDFQLETWLIAIGKQKELEQWRASMT